VEYTEHLNTSAAAFENIAITAQYARDDQDAQALAQTWANMSIWASAELAWLDHHTVHPCWVTVAPLWRTAVESAQTFASAASDGDPLIHPNAPAAAKGDFEAALQRLDRDWSTAILKAREVGAKICKES
jgi:hypothetical protein